MAGRIGQVGLRLGISILISLPPRQVQPFLAVGSADRHLADIGAVQSSLPRGPRPRTRSFGGVVQPFAPVSPGLVACIIIDANRSRGSPLTNNAQWI